MKKNLKIYLWNFVEIWELPPYGCPSFLTPNYNLDFHFEWSYLHLSRPIFIHFIALSSTEREKLKLQQFKLKFSKYPHGYPSSWMCLSLFAVFSHSKESTRCTNLRKCCTKTPPCEAYTISQPKKLSLSLFLLSWKICKNSHTTAPYLFIIRAPSRPFFTLFMVDISMWIAKHDENQKVRQNRPPPWHCDVHTRFADTRSRLWME